MASSGDFPCHYRTASVDEIVPEWKGRATEATPWMTSTGRSLARGLWHLLSSLCLWGEGPPGLRGLFCLSSGPREPDGQCQLPGPGRSAPLRGQ